MVHMIDVKSLSSEDIQALVKNWTEAEEGRTSMAVITDEKGADACYVRGKNSELVRHLTTVAKDYPPLKELLKSTMLRINLMDGLNHAFEGDKKEPKQIIHIMTLNEYQKCAMSTCMPTCNNVAYMLTGLTAEVGEVNDKIAKAIRKGWINIDGNGIKYNCEECSADFKAELVKEIGDCLWFVAGLAECMGETLHSIAKGNIEKLASRKERGVIDGNGDNR